MRKKRIVLKIPIFILFILFQALFTSQILAKKTELFDLSLEELMKITIATKTEMISEEAPSIVSVITANEIKNMGARNLEDVLRTVVGIEVTQDPVAMKIGIRGIFASLQSNNKTKIMLDGHSLGTLLSGDPTYYLWSIPVDNIKQIEIIRGPGSALYGTNAFAGVINIVTKNEEAPSKIAIKAGSFNTYKPTFELSYNDKDIKAYIYGDYYKTDGPREDITSDAGGDLFGSMGFRSLSGKTTYDSEYFNIHTKLKYNDFYLNAFYRETIEKQIPVGIANMIADEDEDNSGAGFTEIGYDMPISDKGSVLFKMYFDYFKHDVKFESFPEQVSEFFSGLYSFAEPYPKDDGIHGGPICNNESFGGEITFKYNFLDHINLVCGGLYEDQKQSDVHLHTANGNYQTYPITIDGITYNPMQYLEGWRDISDIANWNENAERNINAFYIQTIFHLASFFNFESISSLSLTAGVRYDDYDDVGSSTNPRLGIVFAPTEKLYFKALYGQAFRAPNFLELYNKNNPTANANPNVNPETLNTIEGQIRYNFTKNISSSITYFSTTLEDIIKAKPDATGVRKYGNYGNVESEGIETELKLFFGKDKYGYINLTYQDVKDVTNETITSPSGQTYTQKDFFPGDIPEIMCNIGFNYPLNNNIIGNVSLKYIGERKRSQKRKFDSNQNLTYVDLRPDIDSQILVNSTLTFGNFSSAKGIEFQFSCFNIFNEDHIDPEPSGEVANDLPRGGRSFYAKSAYIF